MDPANVLGNRASLEAHWEHASEASEERPDSAPIPVFAGVAVAGCQMGNVRFDGLGIANRAEPVRQRDALSYLDFSGLLSEIRLLDLSESESGGGVGGLGPVSARHSAASRYSADRRASDASSR